MSGLNSIYNNVAYALQLHSKTLTGLQEQAATGSRLNRPSDNPSAAYRLLGLNSQQRYLKNYISNIENAVATQEMTASILQNMTASLVNARVRLTQIVSGTYGEGKNGRNARARVALEINDILEQMVSAANTKHIDQYIFGGHNTSSMPYVVQRTNGEITGVMYQGAADSRIAEFAPGVQSCSSYAGDLLFRMNERGTPVFYGSTGAVVGTGTSSVRGDIWLTVTHDGTNYRLSIDNGATEVVVPNEEDSSNIAVTNANGEVLYVDASNLKAVGSEKVKVPGTYDVFNILIATRDLLRDPQRLSEITAAKLIDEAAQSLEEIKNVLVGKEASIGMKIKFLDTLKTHLEDIHFNEETEASALQDADIAQIAIDISRREVLYQMTLSIAGKVMSMSLLDFIR